MHKGLVHLLPHTLFNDLARFLVGEAVPEIAGEQIAVRVIPRAGLRLGKIRADAERANLPARLDKIQLKAGQLILQVGRGGKVPCAVYRRALCLTVGGRSIFGGAALFQRGRGVVLDQPKALGQRQAALRIAPSNRSATSRPINS